MANSGEENGDDEGVAQMHPMFPVQASLAGAHYG